MKSAANSRETELNQVQHKPGLDRLKTPHSPPEGCFFCFFFAHNREPISFHFSSIIIIRDD